MSRTLLIGLDGASLDLILNWVKAGYLPNIARLMRRGSYGYLRSVMPVLSSAAWVSFMTGVNPGKHGIYDFVQRDLRTYRRYLVRGGRELKVPTLWALLSQYGKQVGVVNVPMTYPPEPVNGFLVSGLGTPENASFTYPEELAKELKKYNYRVNKQAYFRPGNEQAFLEEVYRLTDIQAQAALDLASTRDWDLFMHVVRDPDEMAHFFWRFMDDTHPAYDASEAESFGQAILNYYCHIDGWVGRFVEVAGPSTDVLILSDHGSGPLYKDVLLNAWLQQAGYLSLKQGRNILGGIKARMARWGFNRQELSQFLRARKLAYVEQWGKKLLGRGIRFFPATAQGELSEIVDWSRTKAYSFGYHGQIYVNLKGREALGVVDPADYETICQEITAGLLALIDPDDGKPVVSAVYPKEDLYKGPYLEWAPDLTVIMRDLQYITRQGYEYVKNVESLFTPPHTFESGSHRELGVLIAAGPSFAARGRMTSIPSLMDIAPTVLYLHGVPVPSFMDGTVLKEWLAAEKRTCDVMYTHTPPKIVSGSINELGIREQAGDDEALLEHLRRLGYIE